MTPFWVIVHKAVKTDTDKALIAAIGLLTTSLYRTNTPEDVYAILLDNYRLSFSALDCPSDEDDKTDNRIINLIKKVEDHLTKQDDAIKRLQADETSELAATGALAAALQTLIDAQNTANTRIEADLLALRDAAGSGNADAINAVADSIEANLKTMNDAAAQATAAATAEASVDVALVISPTTAQVAPGGTLSFSSNIHVAWSAQNGSIDASGVYTAPSTGASDVVSAVSDDKQIASASITIG